MRFTIIAMYPTYTSRYVHWTFHAKHAVLAFFTCGLSIPWWIAGYRKAKRPLYIHRPLGRF